MPLLTIDKSNNAKTGDIAQTYRSGAGAVFGTCPKTCKLNPTPCQSASRVDTDYLDALLAAVPRRGIAFTYCHFHWRRWWPRMAARLNSGAPTTTINYSADTVKAALASVAAGVPTVIAMAFDAIKHPKAWREKGTRFVVCPATYRDDAQCANCGGDVPLCARASRDFVVVFPAHGASQKRVGKNTDGGCYASGGNVRLHWNRLSKRAADIMSDGALLLDWARKLPRGRILRHHIAGDIGKVKA